MIVTAELVLSIFSALLVSCATPAFGAPGIGEPHPLEARELHRLADLAHARDAFETGDWQEVAWRLHDRGLYPEAVAFEAHILWSLLRSRIMSVDSSQANRY